MPETRTRHLFDMAMQVSGMQPVGTAPNGNRGIGLIGGGTFVGEPLRGTVLFGGADWIIARPDGCTTLDVRLVLQTDDGATIGVVYRGLRHGPAEIMRRPRHAIGSTASLRSAPDAGKPQLGNLRNALSARKIRRGKPGEDRPAPMVWSG